MKANLPTKTISLVLACLLPVITGLPSLAFDSSQYGPYPATPASWNGQVTPAQPYVPGPGTITPNYVGDGRSTANYAYGDYRNPSTSLQTGTYTGQALTYRPGVTPYLYSSGGTSGGYNPTALIIGGGILGASALAIGARGISSMARSGSGWGGSSGSAGGQSGTYTKDMAEADKRRAKQEEKIMKELKQAHEAEMRRKGVLPASLQNQNLSQNQSQGKPGNSGLYSQRRDSEALEGDVLPASATGKLEF